ncbi:DUF1178 family protein [Thiohalorhabdus sp. Cl-TMA]|uniref:DUF1178 family protein n=1 Tax=Thiohalorhabdus methylotrophus TaxID=3242694 RepID=A0ABV4TTW1_9GAMM
MIVFDILCSNQHRFEGWFANGADFEAQLDNGQLTCPVCGSDRLKRAVSGSRVATGAGKPTAAPGPARGEAAARELMRRVWEHIGGHSEYVGQDFAKEARRMQKGETEDRSIHGEATREEAEALLEEGLAVLPLGPAEDPESTH